MRILYQIKKNGQKIGHHVSNKEFRLFRFLQVQVHAYEHGEFQLEIQIKTHNFAFPECLTVPHSGRTGRSSVRSRQSESVQSWPAHYIRSRGLLKASMCLSRCAYVEGTGTRKFTTRSRRFKKSNLNYNLLAPNK